MKRGKCAGCGKAIGQVGNHWVIPYTYKGKTMCYLCWNRISPHE